MSRWTSWRSLCFLLWISVLATSTIPASSESSHAQYDLTTVTHTDSVFELGDEGGAQDELGSGAKVAAKPAAKKKADPSEPPTKVDKEYKKKRVPAPTAEVAAKLQIDAKNVTNGRKDLPPAIFGGTQGEFAFTMSSWSRGGGQPQELGQGAEPAAKAAAKPSPKPAAKPAAAAKAKPAAKASEEKSDGQTSANTKPIKVAKPTVDKDNKSLFDLKPLFMGIQADRMRRRALLGGRCILSMNEVVDSAICAQGHMLKDGTCTRYTMPPMSVAMKTLYKNAQTNYCKYNATCDASLCFNYGGPINPKTGLQIATSHEMKDYPIWISHNQTMRNKVVVPMNQTVIAHLVDFRIQLEKVVFCEKIEPPVQTADGSIKTLNCFASRRCKMDELVRKGCKEASAHRSPAPTTDCPKDSLFVNKTRAQENAITATLCAQL